MSGFLAAITKVELSEDWRASLNYDSDGLVLEIECAKEIAVDLGEKINLVFDRVIDLLNVEKILLFTEGTDHFKNKQLQLNMKLTDENMPLAQPEIGIESVTIGGVEFIPRSKTSPTDADLDRRIQAAINSGFAEITPQIQSLKNSMDRLLSIPLEEGETKAEAEANPKTKASKKAEAKPKANVSKKEEKAEKVKTNPEAASNLPKRLNLKGNARQHRAAAQIGFTFGLIDPSGKKHQAMAQEIMNGSAEGKKFLDALLIGYTPKEETKYKKRMESLYSLLEPIASGSSEPSSDSPSSSSDSTLSDSSD